MSIREEYQRKLKTLHRVQGQANRRGVSIEYNEVKRPTRASISQLDKAIEMLRTKLFIKRVLGPDILSDPEPEPEPPSMADIIIDNFRQLVLDMAEDDYALQFSHGFSSDKRTGGGTNAKQNSANRLVGYGGSIGGELGAAIQIRGKEAVAKSIQKNGETLQQLAEDLIFALYERRYAVWGGGRASYETTIIMYFRGILMGAND